jgi:holo-[acyl-carrier protein] synthase
VTVVGVGADLVEVERFRKAITRTASLADRLFSDDERAYASDQHDPAKSLAARFAAKEAVMKALRVGLGDVDFRDIEIVREVDGAPVLAVRGRAAQLANVRGVTEWFVSLSHTESVAMAVAIAVSDGSAPDRS